METYIIIVVAFVFAGFGAWLGHKVGFDSGRDLALRTAGEQIRRLTAELNKRERDAKNAKRNIESQLKDSEEASEALDVKLREARKNTENVVKNLATKEQMYQELLEAAEIAAAARSRESILTLRNFLASDK